MVVDGHPVERRGVQAVAPSVEEAPVLAPIGGDLGVSMEFAAQDPELAAGAIDAV